MRALGVSRRRLGQTGGGAAGALALVACAGGAGTSAPGAQAPAGQGARGVVDAWTVWDGTREALMNEQIADFQARAPTLTVQHSLLQQATMYDKYTAAIAGGTAPDSIMVHGRMLPAMADRGQLQTLDAYLRKDGLKPLDVWYEGEWQGQQWQGKSYGLPLASGGGNYVLYYNRSHFQEAGLDPNRPPKTWDDLSQTAERLTQRGGGGRVGFVSGGLWTQYLACADGRLFTPDLRRVAWNGAEGVAAMQYELDLEKRLYGGRAGMAEALGGATPVQAFAGGRLSMLNNGVYFAFYELKQMAPDLAYGAADFPFNGANPRARSANFSEGGWGYGIPQGAKNPDGAWEWQKYACAGEGNLKFFLAQGRPTPVKRHNERPEFRQASPYFDVLVRTLLNQAPAGVTPAWPEIRTVLNKAVADVGAGTLAPRGALDESAKQSQLLLDQYFAARGGK